MESQCEHLGSTSNFWGFCHFTLCPPVSKSSAMLWLCSQLCISQPGISTQSRSEQSRQVSISCRHKMSSTHAGWLLVSKRHYAASAACLTWLLRHCNFSVALELLYPVIFRKVFTAWAQHCVQKRWWVVYVTWHIQTTWTRSQGKFPANTLTWPA